jgi:hypothetical protein
MRPEIQAATVIHRRSKRINNAKTNEQNMDLVISTEATIRSYKSVDN